MWYTGSLENKHFKHALIWLSLMLGIYSFNGFHAQGGVDAPSPEAFKVRLDVALGSLVQWLVTPHRRRVETGWSLWSFSTQAIIWYDSMIIPEISGNPRKIAMEQISQQRLLWDNALLRKHLPSWVHCYKCSCCPRRKKECSRCSRQQG